MKNESGVCERVERWRHKDKSGVDGWKWKKEHQTRRGLWVEEGEKGVDYGGGGKVEM